MDKLNRKRIYRQHLRNSLYKSRGQLSKMMEEKSRRGRRPLSVSHVIKRRMERKCLLMTTLSAMDKMCFICGKGGQLHLCDNNRCPKGYHLQCIDLPRSLAQRWICPWHYCPVCSSKRQVIKCSMCINSYCKEHFAENIFCRNNLNLAQYFCINHFSAF